MTAAGAAEEKVSCAYVCVKQKERKINERLEEVKVCWGMFKNFRGEDVRADIL